MDFYEERELECPSCKEKLKVVIKKGKDDITLVRAENETAG